MVSFMSDRKNKNFRVISKKRRVSSKRKAVLGQNLTKLEILDIPENKFPHTIPNLEIKKNGKISKKKVVLSVIFGEKPT